MPHQCTACGHVFEDGSKEMLSGCPTCGGTTFQFRPSDASGDDAPPEPPDDPPSPPDRDAGGVAERVGRTATAMRDWMGGDDTPGSSRSGADTGNTAPRPDDPRPGSDDAPDARPASGDPAEATADPGPDPSETGPTTDGAEAAAPDDGGPTADDGPDETAASDGRAPESSTAWPDPPDVSHVRDGETRRRQSADPPDREEPVDAGDGTDAPDGSTDAADTTGDEAPTDAADHPTDEDGLIVADEDPTAAEDTAQASARSEMARPDELPSREPSEDPSSGRVVSEPSDDSPDMAELRAELNDQFESIKIVEPGQYELNLMELYDREEYIISLKENGRYVIQMPEDWLGDRAD